MSALIPVSEKKQPLVPPFAKFIIGGVSGATGQTITHPLDVTKVRMQISGSPLLQTFKDTWSQAGIKGFYAGWSAGFLRQLTYSTTRLGIYTTLFDILESKYGRLNYPTMVTLGLFSGMAGAFVGTPTELMLVRMTADLKLPPEKRWNYKNPWSGMYSIYKKDGFFALWKGAIPTILRAGIANGSQLGTYTRAKMFLKDSGLIKDGIRLQICSGMISSFVMCTISVPVDGAKSRIQNWNQKEPPPGIIKMIITIAKREGIFKLWRGFVPYYTRSGPHAIITMVSVDQLQRLYIKHLIKQE